MDDNVKTFHPEEEKEEADKKANEVENSLITGYLSIGSHKRFDS